MKSYSKVQAFSLAALILSAGLIWIWFSRIPQDQIHKEKILVPKAGFQAPYLVLSTLDGDQIDSNDLSGRPYILNFWASWCPPCKAEMPDLQKVSDEFSDTGLLIIAINASNQDIIQNVKDFVKRENISFLIPLDHSGSAAKDYSVQSLPTTFFIDRQGTISRIIIGGPIPLPLLRTEIGNLLQD